MSSLKAINAIFKEDKTSPGMVLSLLTTGEYYVSVVRYDEAYGQKKRVVYSSKGATLEEAMKATMTQFIEGPDAIEVLKKALA